jgi:hypothetical protein
MTRINRRRIRTRVSTLGEHQRFVLLHGPLAIAIDGPAFSSRKAEERTWCRHRSELMDENLGPGRRPYAYFKFDLGVEPRRWRDEIKILRARGLMSATEERDLEKDTGGKFRDP